MKHSIIILLTLGLFVILSCEDASEASPAITLESSQAIAAIGATISVTAKITDLPADFFAVSMRISYDSDRLTIRDDQSNWIGSIWSSSAIGMLEVESGIIYLSITQVAGAGNVSGDGTVLTLEFDTRQAGIASLDLIQRDLVFYDKDGAELAMNELKIEGVDITIE